MIKAVIFDLDGVIVSTDNCHYKAWKALADREGIPFNKEDNNRLRGVSRMESLNIILEKTNKPYSNEEKQEMATYKNARYVSYIKTLSEKDLLLNTIETIERLRAMGIKTAVGSSSKNAPAILDQLGITALFDAVADGNGIKHSKPAPDVFLLASQILNIKPEDCLVVEDAEAGVEAALNAGMLCLGIGAAQHHPGLRIHADSLADIDLPSWVRDMS